MKGLSLLIGINQQNEKTINTTYSILYFQNDLKLIT